MSPSTILTAAEAGKLIKCSTDHVRDLISRGSLRGFDMSPGSKKRQYRTKVEWVEEFINKQSTTVNVAEPKARELPAVSGLFLRPVRRKRA